MVVALSVASDMGAQRKNTGNRAQAGQATQKNSAANRSFLLLSLWWHSSVLDQYAARAACPIEPFRLSFHQQRPGRTAVDPAFFYRSLEVHMAAPRHIGQKGPQRGCISCCALFKKRVVSHTTYIFFSLVSAPQI
jgi:hypothetical protein